MAYSNEMRNFIHVAKQLSMLNGDYAFLTVSMTLDSDFWDDAQKKYGLSVTDVNGNSIYYRDVETSRNKCYVK